MAVEAGSATPKTLMWTLETGGWTACEAGNLVAFALGIRPVRSGWTVREIEHLRFLRAIVRSGRRVT